MASLFWLTLVLSVTLALHPQINIAESLDVGVCYGMIGDNLPSSKDVVALYKKYGIDSMRLFEPNPEALEALRGSNIVVSLGMRNEDIQSVGSDQEAAISWFSTHVEPYLSDINFQFISMGNEVIPGPPDSYIAPAMKNLQTILDARNLEGIKVTTVVATGVLGTSFPPSSSVFSPKARGPLIDILRFLSAQGSPLMVNVYPYLAYASDPQSISLNYAQFSAPDTVVKDGGLSYQNLFDAIIDAVYWAMEKEGVSNVGVVASETGWPSTGNDNLTTRELAATYNRNLIEHVAHNGTPRRPQDRIETYLFAMFNENRKPVGVEQHWGLFEPYMEPVYPLLTPHD